MDSFTANLLARTGLVVELAACLLVATLMAGLRAKVRRHDFFVCWSWAWVALSVAIATLVLRHYLVPPEAPALAVAPFYAVYQVAKLGFVAMVALGTVSLVTGAAVGRRIRAGSLVAAAGVGLATALVTGTLDTQVAIQAVVAAPAFAFSAWQVGFRLPRERRGLGTTILGIGLAILAVQWLVYLWSFTLPVGLGGWSDLLVSLNRYSAFIDAGEALILGVGMVLTLVEHDHRDTAAAQAERIVGATASRERLGEVLRSAHEGIVTLDRERIVDLLNPAAEMILGIRAEEARGASFDRFLAPDSAPALWDGVAVATRRSEANPPVAIRRELTGRRADGEAFPLELSLSSFGQGGHQGWVLVLRDLTELLQAREEADRIQAQLAHAARLEAIGRMVSGVAHELNNPLTAILAFAQDLAANAPPGEDREALDVIIQQAERCRVIVGDLLIFARNRRDERRRIAPAELVARVGRVFERSAARHQLEFELVVAPDLPPIEVDPAGVEQVLTNLLTNAVQASPPGTRVALVVAARNGSVTFRVDDSGPGIPEQVMPRLFEPFFTTKGPGEGTGLGLSVSHAIVNQHGGAIRAGNRAAGGATFEVELPAVDRRATPGPAGPAPEAIDGAPAGRVLVVDDEAAIRVAIRRALERHGWSVDEAADGEEAWLRLDLGGRAADYDVVITDLRMPGLSGIELVDRIAAVHPSLAERVVVISGDTASPAVAEFLERLKTPFLAKPFDLRTLVRAAAEVRAGARR